MRGKHTTFSRAGRTLAAAAALLISACQTIPPEPEPAPETIRLPEEEPIGRVVRVDVDEEIAVVRLDSTGTRPSPTLIARNDALVETARLEPTRFWRGQTLGARIVSGLPNVGDEVIALRAPLPQEQ